MGYARKSLVCLNDTPYYHVIARCVRRAWLCGFDPYAAKDYSHRKAWVLERLKRLSAAFAIDICAYAVMSNHYHLVLRVDQARAAQWSREEIVQRWAMLFNLPWLIERWPDKLASDAERDVAEALIECWRARLTDISWYMRSLNEHLARLANAEDGCTGRFWEGRFRSQALLDEAGLLTAMAYVDLNPLRAGMAATPEASEFTSIHARLQRMRADRADPAGSESSNIAAAAPELLAFHDAATARAPCIPLTFVDYLELLDWTGRIAHAPKISVIDEHAPRVLRRLSIEATAWRTAMQPSGNVFGRALGRLERLRLHAKALGQSWVKGLRAAELLYRTT